MNKLISKVRPLHDQFFALISYLQSPWARSIICLT